jgi:hypothetical protein
MRNTFRAIKENESVEQIEIEENAKRMANRIMGVPEKKSGGGIVKALIWGGIIVAVIYFITQ